MKKLTLLIITAILAISTSALAAPECPFKNLKKSQRRDADGTAFYPKSAPKASPQNGNSGTYVTR